MNKPQRRNWNQLASVQDRDGQNLARSRRRNACLLDALEESIAETVRIRGSFLLSEIFESFEGVPFSLHEIRSVVERLVRSGRVEAVPHVLGGAWPIPCTIDIQLLKPGIDVELRKPGVRKNS